MKASLASLPEALVAFHDLARIQILLPYQAL
jgi:hypothetical protein